jgi:hypothetical protein
MSRPSAVSSFVLFALFSNRVSSWDRLSLPVVPSALASIVTSTGERVAGYGLHVDEY